MSTLRTIVTFQSNAFNTTQRREYFINDCCYGDDVARWLINELRSRGIQTEEDPGQEDFGWYIEFQIRQIDYQFIISHRPTDREQPGLWIGWLERNVGLLSSVFGGRNRGIESEAVEAINTVLANSAEISAIAWHHRQEFERGQEENGQANPGTP
jgi:hypothetical protein